MSRARELFEKYAFLANPIELTGWVVGTPRICEPVPHPSNEAMLCLNPTLWNMGAVMFEIAIVAEEPDARGIMRKRIVVYQGSVWGRSPREYASRLPTGAKIRIEGILNPENGYFWQSPATRWRILAKGTQSENVFDAIWKEVFGCSPSDHLQQS